MSGDLPKGWAETTLGEIVTLRGEKVLPREYPEANYLGLEDIEPHTSRILRYSRAGNFKSASARFYSGDILYSRLRPYLNKVSVAACEGLASAELLVLKAAHGIDTNFVIHRIMAADFLDFTASLDKGDRPRVDYQQICAFPVSLPPSDEQKNVGKKISRLFARSSRARDELAHIPKLIERYRQAVLEAAFRGDLTTDWRITNCDQPPASSFVENRQQVARQLMSSAGVGRDQKSALLITDLELSRDINARRASAPLPDGWEWTGIGQVFGVYVGATPGRKDARYWGGDVPWVSSGEVAFTRISDTSEKITDLGLASASTRLHPVGTVLLGMIGEGKTRGQAAILDVPACNNQNCAAIRVSEAGYPPEYLYWHFFADYERTRDIGSGNGQQALNKDRVQRLIFPLPPAEEAVEIVNRINKMLAPLELVYKEIKGATGLIDRLDASILDKAFSGQLVPQDPTDEPASKLLERIRAARAAAPAVKRGRKAKGAADGGLF